MTDFDEATARAILRLDSATERAEQRGYPRIALALKTYAHDTVACAHIIEETVEPLDTTLDRLTAELETMMQS